MLDTPVDDHADLEPRDLADGIFQPSADDLLVTLRLDPDARWVAEYYPVEEHRGAARRRAHRSGCASATRPGWCG